MVSMVCDELCKILNLVGLLYNIAALNILKWRDEQEQVQTFHLADKVRVQWHIFGMILGVSLNQLDEWGGAVSWQCQQVLEQGHGALAESGRVT